MQMSPACVPDDLEGVSRDLVKSAVFVINRKIVDDQSQALWSGKSWFELKKTVRMHAYEINGWAHGSFNNLVTSDLSQMVRFKSVEAQMSVNNDKVCSDLFFGCYNVAPTAYQTTTKQWHNESNWPKTELYFCKNAYTLKVQCVIFRGIYWLKWNVIYIPTVWL